MPEDLRNFSEATLAERRNGDLWMVIRTNRGLRESLSSDGGQSWSDPVRCRASRRPLHPCLHEDPLVGAALLVYHEVAPTKSAVIRAPGSPPSSGRRRADLAAPALIDGRAGVSYPDAIEAPDGRIFTVHDLGRYRGGEKAISRLGLP